MPSIHTETFDLNGVKFHRVFITDDHGGIKNSYEINGKAVTVGRFYHTLQSTVMPGRESILKALGAAIPDSTPDWRGKK